MKGSSKLKVQSSTPDGQGCEARQEAGVSSKLKAQSSTPAGRVCGAAPEVGVSSKLKAQSSKNGGHLSSWGEVEAEAQDASGGPLFLRDAPLGDSTSKPWNLEERTALFGEQVVRFSRSIPRDPTNNRLIDQLVGSATSIGANYCEANEAVSRKDFLNTVGRCVTEAKETKFFLRMVAASEPGLAQQARPLSREAHELLLIFAAIRKRQPPA